MATTPYTTADQITLLAGQIAVDLRTDDDDVTGLLTQAIDYASNQVDFYCSKYEPAVLATSNWARDAATFIAVKWLCFHRLNDVPKSIQKEWDDVWAVQLGLIQQGKAEVPRAAHSRNPCSVTNYTVDLRRVNNQVRVDQNRSTGIAQGYRRPTDPTSPDQR